MDLQEVIGDNDAPKDTLIVSKQGHISGTCDGDPEGEPSSPQAKIWLFGPKLAQETHIVED